MTLHNLFLAAVVIMFVVFGATLFSVQLYVLGGRGQKRAADRRSIDQPSGGGAVAHD